MSYPCLFPSSELDEMSYFKARTEALLAVMLERESEPPTKAPYDFSTQHIDCILPQEVYLGNASYTSDELQIFQIRTIVNVAADVPHQRFADMKDLGIVEACHHFPMHDSAEEDLLSRLDEIVAVLENCPKPVIVSCRGGISRSATVVMAYLVKKNLGNSSWARSPLKAYQTVLKKRRAVMPNLGFVRQLEKYHEKLQLELQQQQPERSSEEGAQEEEGD